MGMQRMTRRREGVLEGPARGRRRATRPAVGFHRPAVAFHHGTARRLARVLRNRDHVLPEARASKVAELVLPYDPSVHQKGLAD